MSRRASYALRGRRRFQEPLRDLVAGLDPGLSRAVWTLQAGMLVSAVGTGMVLPFLLIYLHNVRGFALTTSGLLSGLSGVPAASQTSAPATTTR